MSPLETEKLEQISIIFYGVLKLNSALHMIILVCHILVNKDLMLLAQGLINALRIKVEDILHTQAFWVN